MADHSLKATRREEFGKGAARRIRRAGDIPAVLYGHGTDPVHLTLPGRETFLALRQANVLFTITIEGDSKPVLALPKQVQRDPILPIIEHVDLLLVKAGEKVTVDIPIVIVGEVREGILNQELQSLSIEASATNIPTEIEIDVAALEVGAHVTVADVALPEGAVAMDDAEALVLGVILPAAEAPAEAEGEEAAAE
ncbi:50S ribosomal protein L25/general stress protein Ctc [Tessaracoccus caeni]|uniref:50S ribosomal protein L25/general stress protein Ctc n=1 Tax=Tessaracoccus caeni TaxID=3031239 RepID=UPI0023DACA2A|nr:50S ribosomal protein L25/general stress protein Ctc [Tessaracoccus caeni]MDF1489007.1 50S ribosomal protein L25/general stress protein Ctc [Tessaracoccus caeni]